MVRATYRSTNPERRNKTIARKRYPGKFEACDDDRLAEVLYASDTNADCGEADTTGWYGLILHRNHGYIVSEDGNGFFCYERFETREEAETEYERIEFEIAEKYESMEGHSNGED